MTHARRPSTPVFAGLALLGAALAIEAGHALVSAPGGEVRMAASAEKVRAYGLTDLALFTEARYTRHPALADLHTAFQDNPMSFEHFPSGTFVPIPAGISSGQLGFGEEAGQ